MVQETRRESRRLLHSLFVVLARDLLASLARSGLKFIRLLRVVFSSQSTTEGVIKTRSNRMKFKLCSKSNSKALPFYKLRTPERNLKIIKILSSLRSKMSPEITPNDRRVLILHV